MISLILFTKIQLLLIQIQNFQIKDFFNNKG